MTKEMALLRRINEQGMVEEVRLMQAKNEKSADGYYPMETIFLRGYHEPSPPKLIPVTIVPTGHVFPGMPDLEYINQIIEMWTDSFIPNLQQPNS